MAEDGLPKGRLYTETRSKEAAIKHAAASESHHRLMAMIGCARLENPV
jgi:hypothetical protein